MDTIIPATALPRIPGNELQKKLQEALDKTGISLVDIARRTGINKESVYKWYRGTKPSDTYVYNKLMKFLDELLAIAEQPLNEFNANFSLLEDAGTDFISQRNLTFLLRIPLQYPFTPLPAIRPKGGPGCIVNTSKDAELIVHRIDAPFLGEVLGVVDVVGHNMEPTLANGSRIVLVAVYDQGLLEWGKCYYIIDKNHQGMVMRLHPGDSENSIRLLSDNQDQAKYPPLIRTWDQIEAIFKVKTYILNL